MPRYQYRCTECGVQEFCIAGVDDRTAICVCDGLMLRQDEDVFKPYFKQTPDSEPSPAQT